MKGHLWGTDQSKIPVFEVGPVIHSLFRDTWFIGSMGGFGGSVFVVDVRRGLFGRYVNTMLIEWSDHGEFNGSSERLTSAETGRLTISHSRLSDGPVQANLLVEGEFGRTEVSFTLTKTLPPPSFKERRHLLPTNMSYYWGCIGMLSRLDRDDCLTWNSVAPPDAALWYAVQMGLKDKVRELLDGGACVDSLGAEGRTPLMQAVRSNEREIVSILLEKGANVDARSRDDWSPLMEAVVHNRFDLAKMLLEKGAIVEGVQRNNWTLLSAATHNASVQMVELLLECGADPSNKSHYYHKTPLMYAAEKGDNQMVKSIIAAGVDVNAKDYAGMTPLFFAVVQGHTDTVRILLAVGADPSVKSEGGLTVFDLAAKKGFTEILDLLRMSMDRSH